MGSKWPGIKVRKKSIQIWFNWDGQRVWETLDWSPTPANVERAGRFRQRVITQIEAGVFDYAAEFPDSPRAQATAAPLFFDVAQEYLDSLAVSANTRTDYRRILTRTWSMLFDRRIDRIAYADLHDCIVSSGLHQKSAKYHNNELTPCKGVFKLAKLKKWIKDNPADELQYRKQPKPQPDPFTRDEAEAIIQHIHSRYGEAWGDYFETAFFTGLRNPSELIALPVENVDFDRRCARIDRARPRGSLELQTKTNQVREVYLNDRALAALRRTRSRNGTQAGEVFRQPNSGKEIITGKVQWDIWRATLSVLGIRHRKMYNTRHTYATILLEEGVNPAYAAEQLGHSLKMFFEVYAKWINAQRTQEEQKKINAGVGGSVARDVAQAPLPHHCHILR